MRETTLPGRIILLSTQSKRVFGAEILKIVTLLGFAAQQAFWVITATGLDLKGYDLNPEVSLGWGEMA